MRNLSLFLVSAILFIFPLSLFAAPNVSLFMQTWVKFSSNDGLQELPQLLVTDGSGGSITPANGFTVILPKDADILWEKKTAQVQLNGVPADVTYDKTLKKMTVPVTKTFAAGETATVVGAKVRVYERAATYRNLGLDVTGDGVSDADGVNGIQIDDGVLKNDSLLPYAISGLTVSQTGNSVALSWENPPDIDLSSVVITRTLTRGSSTTPLDSSVGVPAAVYTDNDIKAGDRITYLVRSKDNVGNFGEGVSTDVVIPADQNLDQEAGLESSGTSTDVLTPELPKSVLNSVSRADIEDIARRYTDFDSNGENASAIAYLIKNGIFGEKTIGGKVRKLKLAQKLKTSEFANVAAKAFSVSKNGGSHFKTFVKAGYLPKTAKAGKSIQRKDAFRALLKMNGIDSATELPPPLPELNKLRSFATKGEIAVWIVQVLDYTQ